MPGRFKKAPLVYVTARIQTTELPDFLADQQIQLQQAMIQHKMPEYKSASLDEIQVSMPGGGADHGGDVEIQPMARKRVRRAFFSDERKECLLLEANFIEFRTVAYTKYSDFIARFAQLLSALVSSVPVYGDVLSHEFSLSYADIIVPFPGRSLEDYFANDGKLLPLDAFFPDDDAEPDEFRVGQVQISRITAPNQRIDMTLEQLPVKQGRLLRYLPAAMAEPDGRLSMPLLAPHSVPLDEVPYYGLLMTQAAKLEKLKLVDVELHQSFASLHELTKQTFWRLINERVCKKDWEFEE